MPIRRRDGFSDDGLSYSVASDFDKQIGQAMADYDARAKDPRFVAGARVQEPDSPDILRQELIDPVFASFGMGTSTQGRHTIQPKTYEVGSNLVQLDPQTGAPRVVYSSPAKPTPDLTPRQRLEYGDLTAQRRALMGKSYLMEADKNRLAELDSQIKGYFPQGGDVLGLGPAGAPAAGPVKPGQRGRLDSNGARSYLNRFSGDRAKAEAAAIQDGYSLE